MTSKETATHEAWCATRRSINSGPVCDCRKADAERGTVGEARERIEAHALKYHKVMDGTGEGEYGCPGVECPGVQRLANFASAIVESETARLVDEVRRLRGLAEDLAVVDSVLSYRTALDGKPDRIDKINLAIKIAQSNDPKGDLAAALTRAEQAEAEAAALRSTIRTMRDAIQGILGDPENCEECAALSETGDDSPCRCCASADIWNAYQVANEVLGPCECGHKCSEHFDEDTTRCRLCECSMFKLRPVAPERTEP